MLKKHFASDLDQDNFVIVNKYLQLKTQNNIFVAGDVASIKEEKLAQNAEMAADVVVKNLLILSKNENGYEEYKTKPRAKLISLGKIDGVFVMENLSFGGFIPAIMKEFVEWKVMAEYRYR